MKVCAICQRCYSDAVEVCRQDGSDEFVRAGKDGPEMVPGYTLTRRVDASRNREIYEAQENTSGSPCIVKLFSTSAGADRVLREAKTVNSLFISGVTGVYDTGTIDDGRVFVVSEVAKGQSLLHLLADVGTPDLLASVEIVRQIAETLHALHDNGITHGAISPGNIYLSSGSGEHAVACIDNVDYGRVVEQAITSNKFEIDLHIDALRYLSPEQCTGGERTPRSDVYSLGVVFYELLAGAPPFDSTKGVELIEKHRSERPPELRINNFELRMLVTHALSESLQKQPSFRQSSANAFARQLRHIEQLATHSSTPPPAVRTDERVASTAVGSSPRVEIYQPATVVASRRLDEPAKVSAKIVDPEITHVAPRASIEKTPKPIELAEASTVEEISVPPPTPSFVAEVAPPTLPKRSRLRSLKRKLHTLSAAVASTIERGTLASITGELATLATKDEAPPKKTPRKIEWMPPEDDIPSVEDVVKVLADDGKVEAELVRALPTPQEQPHAGSSLITLNLSESTVISRVPVVEAQPMIAKPVETPKVELSATVIAKPVESPKVEHPELVIAKPVEAPKVELSKSVIAKPAEAPKVELSEPVITKPVEAPKVELSKPVIAKPVETPKVELSEPVIAKPVETPKATSPRPKTLETAVEKAPAKPAVVVATAPKPVESKPKPDASAPVAQVAKPQPAFEIPVQRGQFVVTQPQFADDDEEITLVRPPKRKLRIDLEKPRTIYRAQTAFARSVDEISFQPTMIGTRKEKRHRPTAVPELQDGMFSAHFGSSSQPTDLKYRAMAIGVGCIFLATLFLFASDAVSRFFQNASPGDSTTAQATLSDTVSATSPKADPVFKPTRASLRNSSQSTVPERTESKAADENKPKIGASNEKEKLKATAQVTKTASKLVQEKPIKRAEPEPPKKQPPTRPAFPDLGRPSGATRPRIVSGPRQ